MQSGKAYKFLEHTADLMFEAYGKSYEEALANAAAALFSIYGTAQAKEKASFSITAHNMEELTVAALADLVSYMDTHEIIFSKMEVEKFDAGKNSLAFSAYGEKKRPRDHVKAVTYHELMVKEESGKWKIRILLDV